MARNVRWSTTGETSAHCGRPEQVEIFVRKVLARIVADEHAGLGPGQEGAIVDALSRVIETCREVSTIDEDHSAFVSEHRRGVGDA